MYSFLVDPKENPEINGQKALYRDNSEGTRLMGQMKCLRKLGVYYDTFYFIV